MGFFFCSPPRPDQLWCSPSLLSNGYRGLFPRGKSGRGPKLTTHLHPVPKLRMRGAIPPLSNTSSWCGSQLSTGITLLLPLPFLPRYSTQYTVHTLLCSMNFRPVIWIIKTQTYKSWYSLKCHKVFNLLA